MMISKRTKRALLRIRVMQRGAGMAALALAAALSPGCATVPGEAAALSKQIGQDIEQLYTGYRRTIVFSFDHIRTAGLAVIEHQWTPVFLNDFTKKGQLLEFAQAGNTAAVNYWSQTAVSKIEEKRRAFLDEVDRQEQALLAEVDVAFARTMRANAVLTAHITSVRKVDELHDRVREEFGLQEVNDRITNGLANASDTLADFTQKLQHETEQLQEAP